MDRVNISAANSRRILGGQNLVDVPPGEKVVISGISGYFPNSDNVQDLMENLYNKIDLCDDDERRWTHTNDEIPKLLGKVNNLERFDCGFFGIQQLQANWMDPMCRLLLERSVEAIMDAGINPEELKGTNTGVFVGATISEMEKYSFYSNPHPNTYPILGCTRSMLPQRISYMLELNGPSFCSDTACSSGLYAFEVAYRAIREGRCERAIVAAAMLCTEPMITLQFARLGVLNMNTGCRPFDRDGAGYTRSEGIVAMVLQKEKQSRRIYAKIVHSKVNADGFKDQGITFPSSGDQLQLLRNVYEECRVDPTTVAYLEAHGTGTNAGDPAELSAIDTFFCTNRSKPLLIGSVKGNIGHSEPVSGLCSVIKVLFGMHFEYIPPNIHYDNPRQQIPALTEKRVTVVTEKTRWPTDSRLGAINNFGFGGANGHVLLEKFDKNKEDKYDDVPRLICFSGRTKHAIETIQDHLRKNDLDYEFIRLIQEIFNKDMKNHIYRGYSIILPKMEIQRSARRYNREKYTLYLCIGNKNISTCSILKEYQTIIPFKETYERCMSVLHNNNVNIQLEEDEEKNILQEEILNTITHLGIIDIFKALNITFNHLRGFSMGEFATAYANGTLTLEEAIMASYTTAKHFVESPKSDSKDFEKLLAKLQKIINRKDVNMSVMQTSKSNKFSYGSAEYFVFSILNPSLVSTYPPLENSAVVVNVNYNCNSDEPKINLEVVKRDLKIIQLLICIGKLYELGYSPCVDKLFPEIEWPVSTGTAMFSPLVKWNHSIKYHMLRDQHILHNTIIERVVRVSIMESDSAFYKGHVIDGRILFPATGYLVLVWQIYAELRGVSQDSIRIGFENVKFLRATTFSVHDIALTIIINTEGYFDITESHAPVASGRVYIPDNLVDLPKPVGGEKDEILLSQRDFYNELRLRGYQYKGAFKAVNQMNGDEGLINWASNWIPFLDNMLQLSIIKEDTRSLAVPTGVDRLIVDPENFLKYVKTFDKDKPVPCYINTKTTSIYTRSIQIIGMRTSTIARKRQIYEPVLETYKFVPNTLQTNISDSIRINMQIVLENKQAVNMKILEFVDEDSDTLQPLSPEIVNILDDFPFVQPEITVFTKKRMNIKIKGIHLETVKVSYDRSNSIYIGSSILQNDNNLKIAMSAIDTNGFIISIEATECSTDISGLNILTKHKINNKFLYLLMKMQLKGNPRQINVSNLEEMETWLDTLKTDYKSLDRVILYAQNNDLSGILGLTNCIRREPNGDKVSCFFIRDKAPTFDNNCNLNKKQIDKHMSINVFQDGQWGTYRFLICNPNVKVKCEHFYGSTGIRGDLSSLEWFQGKLSTRSDNICNIYYSALNFKDVMLASGKLPVESVVSNRIEQQCVEGFEFSGRDKDGNRIMGIANCGSNSNLVQSKSTWKVPSCWSLQDAATVPVVYLTVLKAFSQANIKPGQSVLIHSGTGGIGQAALNICEYYKSDVFTTVGTKEKKEYLMKHYPNLKPTHIGNSRNTTFEEMISRETNGRGVDIVLNSLSEDKLHASLRCLAKGGYFMEIGKYDLSNDTRISADLLNKGCTYQGITLDVSLKDEHLFNLFQSMLNTSHIKPLKGTIFEIDELKNAFRYIATGKHIGKVLIKIREEEKQTNVNSDGITHYAIPKFYCDPDLSYIILGGLGGFGLQLADWLMLRGAKTLILSSRSGITTGYQQSRIRNWRDNGVKTIVLMDDITTYEGCRKLIKQANGVAPVGGIFNLAVEIRDAILENLTYSDFQASLSPKAYATIHLDKLSQEFCPKLNHFVVFSSISCGRGNAGQANYGMSNSIMERICERRKSAGLPALAIQWGAIGDVGLLVKLQKEATDIIAGSLQQRISSCLDVLDKFLKQNEPVVSSIVVAEKFGSTNNDNLVDSALSILGISDIKTISMSATFAELGMDSMVAIEMRQTLEREYGVYISENDIRSLTFTRLLKINESQESNLSTIKEANFDITKLLTINIFDKDNYEETTVEFIANKDPSKLVLFIPGIEGTYVNSKPILNNIKYSVICLQYNMQPNHEQFEDVVQYYFPIAKDIIKTSKSFNIVSHSFGGVLALEIVSILEKQGYVGKVVLIDSSPDYLLKLLGMLSSNFDEEYEVKLSLKLLENYLPPEKLSEATELLIKAETPEDRKQIYLNTVPDDSTPLKKYLYESGQTIFAIIMAFIKYKCSFEKKLKSKILLCKSSLTSIKDISENYNLSNYVENLEIGTFEGSHITILENKEMIEKIHVFLDN